MTAAVRICLLAGCVGLSLLDAPRAGALLVQGAVGPYRQAREVLEDRPADYRAEIGTARLPLVPASLFVSDREPWRQAPTAGL